MRLAAPVCSIVLSCLLLAEGPVTAFVRLVQHAQEQSIALGLREAVEMALSRLDRTTLGLAEWKIVEERRRLWPELHVRGRYTYDSSSLIERAGGAVLDKGEKLQRYGGDLVLNYNVLQFLDSAARMREAMADERTSILRLSQEEADTSLKVCDAYLKLVSKWEAQHELDELKEDYLDFMRRVEERFEKQMISAIEQARARSQLIALDREILAVSGEAVTAELELRKLTGIKPEHPLHLTFEPGDLDLAFIKGEGLPGLLASARDGNPRLLAAGAAVESARSRAAATRSLYYPTLSVTASSGMGRDQVLGGGEGASTDFRYTFSSTLGIPLFDGGVRRARVVQADLRVESQVREAQRAIKDVKALVEEGYWAFVEKEQDVGQIQEQVGLAEEEIYHAKARAAEGVSTISDVLTALAKLVRLKQDLTRARSETFLRGIRLSLAVGRNPFVRGLPSREPAQVPPPAPNLLSFPPATLTASRPPTPAPVPAATPRMIPPLPINLTASKPPAPASAPAPAASPIPAPLAILSGASSPPPLPTAAVNPIPLPPVSLTASTPPRPTPVLQPLPNPYSAPAVTRSVSRPPAPPACAFAGAPQDPIRTVQLHGGSSATDGNGSTEGNRATKHGDQSFTTPSAVRGIPGGCR